MGAKIAPTNNDNKGNHRNDDNDTTGSDNNHDHDNHTQNANSDNHDINNQNCNEKCDNLNNYDNKNDTDDDSNNKAKDSLCHIDKRMLSSKLAYFFEYAKEGSHWPYLVLFYVSIGLDPAQAGFISGLRFIGGILGGPVCGWLADRSGRHRDVAFAVCLIAGATNMCQPVVSMLLGNPNKNSCHKTHHSYQQLSTSPHSSQNRDFPMTGNYSLVGNFTVPSNSTRPVQSVGKARELFYTLLLVSSLGSFFDGSTMGFVDSGVLRKIISSPTPTDIGKQRLFGPMGVGMAASVSGLLVDHFPSVNISCYTAIFINYVIACTGTAITFRFLLSGTDDDDDEKVKGKVPTPLIEEQKQLGMSVNQLLMAHLGNVERLVFLFIVFFNGMALALAFSFSFLFLEKLHTPNVVKGASLCANGLSGLAGFLLSNSLIQRLGGSVYAMAVSCLCWGVRYFLLSLMSHPYEFLFICLLNGLTCSLFVSAYVEYIRTNFPPKIFTVVCGIAAALYNSGGYFVANIIGGVGYEYLGPRVLFHLCGVACVVCSLLTFVYGVLSKGRCFRPGSGFTKEKG